MITQEQKKAAKEIINQTPGSSHYIPGLVRVMNGELPSGPFVPVETFLLGAANDLDRLKINEQFIALCGSQARIDSVGF